MSNERRVGPRPRRFPAWRPTLLQMFGALSLIIVAGIGVALGLVMQESIRTRAITDAARTGEVAANVGVRPFLSVADLEQNFVPLTPERVAELDGSLGSSLSPNGIVRIKVWNRQHWLVYSDNPALRGRWFAGAETLERAFDGEITSEITDLSAPEEREERDFGELLAVYVPLRSDGSGAFASDDSGEVIGAFEIYLPFAPIAADIRSDVQRLWVALALGLAVLYVTLFRLVAGASARLRRQAAQNLHLATHDSLTGLANRDAFTQAIDRRLGTGGPDLVLLFDIDQFRRVNDTLGHDVGDQLLQMVATRLEAVARSSDVVARLGGDEFGILAAGVDRAETPALVARFLRALEEPIELAGVRLDVRATVGAVISRGDLGGDVSLQRADIATHAAKLDHSLVAFYTPELDQFSADALELAADVKTGIDEGQFELHYQPKYALDDRRLVGAEALIRWNHPERGMVSPFHFMPTVEQLPIGRDVSNHVLDMALSARTQWAGRGLDLGVSVNLSARDVNDPTLPGTIAALLERHGVAAETLTIELTESTVLSNEERTISVLERIRDLGCKISIDDFGTGYASLSYLIKLPASELKIDQAFVRDLDTDEQSRTIFRHCVDIAHSLGLTATAEGIETEAIEAIVAAFGCDTGQGYLMSRPLPFEQFVEFASAAHRHQETAR